MSVAVSLRSLALGSSAVTDLIANRFYAKYAPQGAVLPYVVARRISTRPEGHIGGGAQTFADRWQVETYAATAESCESVTEALRARLDGWRGLAGTDLVYAVLLENEIDDVESPQDGGEGRIHWTAQDYTVWHRRSTT